jgi:type IV secretory pathway TrbF-like protein
MQAVAKKKWAPEGRVETRYRKARKEWDDHMGGAVIQARNGRLATLLALASDNPASPWARGSASACFAR